MEYGIKELKADDKQSVLKLLSAEDELRTEDILAKGTRYWGAYSDGALIGVIGCEYQGTYGLVRSACVEPACRGNGVGAALTQTLMRAARDAGLEALYLFSTIAGAYWLRAGFSEAPVAEVAERLPDAYQVKLFARLGWLPTEEAFKYVL
jgi:N-acetylglutamate synthase-like GNAT family acetyltransferase